MSPCIAILLVVCIVGLCAAFYCLGRLAPQEIDLSRSALAIYRNSSGKIVVMTASAKIVFASVDDARRLASRMLSGIPTIGIEVGK